MIADARMTIVSKDAIRPGITWEEIEKLLRGSAFRAADRDLVHLSRRAFESITCTAHSLAEHAKRSLLRDHIVHDFFCDPIRLGGKTVHQSGIAQNIDG